MSWAFGFGTGSSGSPFDPTHVANLLAWYRGDLLVTSSAGSVSAWGDSSGAGDSNRNALQASGSNQPTLNASDASYNSQSTLSFNDAGHQFLKSGTWSVTPAQPITVIVVGQMQGSGGAQQYYFDAITASQMTAEVPTGGGNLNLYAGAFLGHAMTTNVPMVIAAQFNGASSKIFQNDHATPITTGNAGTNVLTGITIGSAFGGIGGTYAHGTIAELIVYGAAVSTADMGSLFSYLGTRYGIATT